LAGSVVVTVGDAHERLMPALVDATEKLRVGDGLDEHSDVGPVISDAARERVVGWIDRSERVLVDGRQTAQAAGCYVGPTIVEVDRDDPIVGEEVFGPLLAVVRADSLDDAIGIVNRSRFGNGTSIFTESAAAVRRYRHDVEAGMVGVNIGVAAPVAFFPFSGWKDSFLGDLHAHGPDAVDFYTRKKTVTSRYFSSGQGSGAYFVER
jgi:malonate-semialdehyde dehydrogenase (acetylating)/methylmalonate-semialdehyde dehydrogenase